MVEHLDNLETAENIEQLSELVAYGQYNDFPVWDIKDMKKAMEQQSLDKGEQHFKRVASGDDVNKVIVIVGGSDDLGREVLQHVASEWTSLAEETQIDATAYVSEGMARLAISQKNEADIETKGFKTIDSAVDWLKRL
jgi:hypothetical protein